MALPSSGVILDAFDQLPISWTDTVGLTLAPWPNYLGNNQAADLSGFSSGGSGETPPGSGNTPPTKGQIWPRGNYDCSDGDGTGGGDTGGGSQATLVTPTSADSGTVSSVSVSTPSTAQTGDVFVVMAASNGRVLTAPAGFTQLALDDWDGISSHLYAGLWWKRLGADGVTTATVTISSAVKFRAVGITLRGAADPVLLGKAHTGETITATPAVDSYGLWTIAWDPTLSDQNTSPATTEIASASYIGAFAEMLTGGASITRDTKYGGDRMFYGVALAGA